ncbi:MAG: FG-GAP repeat protein, partial [Limisphaerales bacterium]
MAVSGDTAVVGTRLTQQMSPSAYVFVYDGTTWQEQAKLDAGGAVGISGDTIVVGDQVFVRNGTTWLFQSQLIASNADTNDFFGRSVAISGDTIVVGAVLEDGSSQAINGVSHQNSTDAGAAYVFVRTGVTWSQEAYLKGSDVIAGDWFGYSVAVEDDAVLVGAPEKTVASRDAAGKSYVFVRNGSVWTEQATLVAPAGVFSGR